ncbi:hypothetical protein [Myxosarcina sp. GI1]|uniref:hypothetical protein n=1 Tax=Myxosarcina sp. GI1 TaxID=1541065 RepID=UPI00068B746E|nr:hypothetical protein [Myxosarcina sp. GI1]
MARRRGERIPVYVSMGELKYGFQTNQKIHDAYKDALGQTGYAGAVGVFFGANSPKPFRAAKEFGNDLISSYCSSNKVSSLKKNGWSVTRKGSIRGLKLSGKTRTVYVQMPGGWNYAWNITAAEAKLSSTLGFTVADSADDLVWGVNSPKPPRAYKKEADGVVSTFIAPKQSVFDKASNEGWSITNNTVGVVAES